MASIVLGNQSSFDGSTLEVQWLDRDPRKLKKTNMAQWLLAMVQRVKHCTGAKNRSLSRLSAFKTPNCKHHKM